MEDLYQYSAYTCPNVEFYKNSKLVNNFKTIFSNDIVKKGTSYHAGGNRTDTTSGLPALDAFKIPGTGDLTNWITSCLLDSSEKFTNKKASGIKFLRNWINIYHNRATMACHNHIAAGIDSHVAIFYQTVPKENYSKFVFVRTATWDQPLAEIAVEDQQILDVHEGLLLVHHSSAWHAVTQHLNDEPRIAMIFDFLYEFN